MTRTLPPSLPQKCRAAITTKAAKATKTATKEAVAAAATTARTMVVLHPTTATRTTTKMKVVQRPWIRMLASIGGPNLSRPRPWETITVVVTRNLPQMKTMTRSITLGRAATNHARRRPRVGRRRRKSPREKAPSPMEQPIPIPKHRRTLSGFWRLIQTRRRIGFDTWRTTSRWLILTVRATLPIGPSIASNSAKRMKS